MKDHTKLQKRTAHLKKKINQQQINFVPEKDLMATLLDKDYKTTVLKILKKKKKQERCGESKANNA